MKKITVTSLNKSCKRLASVAGAVIEATCEAGFRGFLEDEEPWGGHTGRLSVRTSSEVNLVFLKCWADFEHDLMSDWPIDWHGKIWSEFSKNHACMQEKFVDSYQFYTILSKHCLVFKIFGDTWISKLFGDTLVQQWLSAAPLILKFKGVTALLSSISVAW